MSIQPLLPPVDRGGVRVLVPYVVPAPTYSQKIARQILDQQVTVQTISLEGPWALDLSESSCELCGGLFPTKGDAEMFLSQYGDPCFLHLGCERQVEDWA